MDYTITKDFMGWAVCITDNTKNIESVKLGFTSREDAERYATQKREEFYKGSGVTGNAI